MFKQQPFGPPYLKVMRTLMFAFLAWSALTPNFLSAASSGGKDDGSEAFFRSGTVREIKIEVPAEGMRTLEHYHQVWGEKRPDRQDVHATIRDGTDVYTNVAIHLKGSFTFQPVNKKPSLTLNFDKWSEGQRYHGMDKIHLNNSVQDATFLCEKFARTLFREAGVPASRIGSAHVTLNGRDLGFYVLIEAYNKRLIKRFFHDASGNLYDGGSGGDITKPLDVDSGEHRDDRSDLEAAAAACREKGNANRFAALSRVVDVDRFITFAALEVLLQHWDGYCTGPNNYRVFHDVEHDKLVFMPHGADQIFSLHRPTTPSLTPAWKGIVARGFLTTATGRRLYLAKIQQLMTNQFQEPILIKRVDEWAAQIRDSGALGWMERLQFENGVKNLKKRIRERMQEVAQQLQEPEPTLPFPNGDTVALTGWRFREGLKSSMQGMKSTEDQREAFRIEAQGTADSASWRKTVMLDSGHYEFQAQACVKGVPATATNSGVVLRLSGDRENVPLLQNTKWSPLTCAFEVSVPMEVELVCEFRGTTGFALFDAGSLKLKRKPAAATPEKAP